MQKTFVRAIPIVILLLASAAAVYYLGVVAGDENGLLQASGTVEAVEIAVAAEVPGQVVEVLVDEGDLVAAGDVLYRLDDALLVAQLDQAKTAKDAAEAAQRMAEVNLEAAHLQLTMAMRAARQAERLGLISIWVDATPAAFQLPAWYFSKEEEIAAVEAEVEAAESNLDVEETNLKALLDEHDTADLETAETRLIQALGAYEATDAVQQQVQTANNAQIEALAQDQFEAAETELEAAQEAYDNLLSANAAEDVLEARARVALARERYFTALDQLAALQTGEDALEVQLAQLGVEQAEAAVEQARIAIAQAEAQLALIELQIAKLTVTAPAGGIITTRNLEIGEVLPAGVPFLTIGQLDALTITVYLPEDRYGAIALGDEVEVQVDSFPAETFNAVVVRIADQAEFTPRNVQTAEGRRSTVFAIELAVEDPAGKLRPGMPADVTFED